jgi:hypothetical protein
MDRTLYEIALPNGRKLMLWFIGRQLEEILKAYNIPYKVIKDKKNKRED